MISLGIVLDKLGEKPNDLAVEFIRKAMDDKNDLLRAEALILKNRYTI